MESSYSVSYRVINKLSTVDPCESDGAFIRPIAVPGPCEVGVKVKVEPICVAIAASEYANTSIFPVSVATLIAAGEEGNATSDVAKATVPAVILIRRRAQELVVDEQ